MRSLSNGYCTRRCSCKKYAGKPEGRCFNAHLEVEADIVSLNDLSTWKKRGMRFLRILDYGAGRSVLIYTFSHSLYTKVYYNPGGQVFAQRLVPDRGLSATIRRQVRMIQDLSIVMRIVQRISFVTVKSRYS